MTQSQIFDAARLQLAIDCCCAPEDFERDGTLFYPLKDLPGRRPFPRGETHLTMTTLGKSVIVSATDDLLPSLRGRLEGKSRDQAFSMPFVYGLSLYYLPELNRLRSVSMPIGYTVEWFERADMENVYTHQGFHNAVMYDMDHPRPDVLVALARRDGEAVGMAGASADCESLWQVGIDVVPTHRGHGLAAALVDALTQEILARGKVPYYGTAASNVASQRVAHRVGYSPAWMCSYQHIMEALTTLPNG